VEERAVTDHLLLVGEGDAALAYGIVEILYGLEVAIDEWLIDEGPQVLGGLQLGTVGGLEDEADAVRNDEVLGPVPAGIVELQHNAPLAPRTDRLGEVGKHELEYALLMLLETFHTVRPVAGSTKPVT
jgi:hypothetical protein